MQKLCNYDQWKKSGVLVLLALINVWLTAPRMNAPAYAGTPKQAEQSPLDTPTTRQSPLDTPSTDDGENRNNDASPANSASQNQSPLATPQEAEPTPTAEPSPTLTPTTAPTLPPTETPTPLPTVAPTEPPLPTGEATEAPTEIPTEVPTEVPTVAPTEPVVNAYPPEEGAVPRAEPVEPSSEAAGNIGEGGQSSNAGQGPQTSIDVQPGALDSLFSLEAMILALLCLIFISVNILGIVALIVTMLYIRSRRDQPY